MAKKAKTLELGSGASKQALSACDKRSAKDQSN